MSQSNTPSKMTKLAREFNEKVASEAAFDEMIAKLVDHNKSKDAEIQRMQKDLDQNDEWITALMDKIAEKERNNSILSGELNQLKAANDELMDQLTAIKTPTASPQKATDKLSDELTPRKPKMEISGPIPGSVIHHSSPFGGATSPAPRTISLEEANRREAERRAANFSPGKTFDICSPEFQFPAPSTMIESSQPMPFRRTGAANNEEGSPDAKKGLFQKLRKKKDV